MESLITAIIQDFDHASWTAAHQQIGFEKSDFAHKHTHPHLQSIHIIMIFSKRATDLLIIALKNGHNNGTT